MPVYTVVEEGYEIDVYTTRKRLCETLAAEALFFDPVDEAGKVPVTASGLAQRIRKNSVVRLYRDGESDWAFRVQRHDKRR